MNNDNAWRNSPPNGINLGSNERLNFYKKMNKISATPLAQLTENNLAGKTKGQLTFPEISDKVQEFKVYIAAIDLYGLTQMEEKDFVLLQTKIEPIVDTIIQLQYMERNESVSLEKQKKHILSFFNEQKGTNAYFEKEKVVILNLVTMALGLRA
jgi:hypothetical protein